MCIIYLQAACESCRFIFNNRGLWRLTHDNQFLVGHHDDPWKLWEPYPDMDKTLKHESLSLVKLSPIGRRCWIKKPEGNHECGGASKI